MDTLSYSNLVQWLATYRGLAIVGLHCVTNARVKRTNASGQRCPWYLTIHKRVATVGLVGSDYELSVNREALRQDKQPAFTSSPLPWGQWLIPGKVIQHGGKLYLRTQTTPGNRRMQPARVIAYETALGSKLTYEQVKPWLPVVRESAKQQVQTGIGSTVWVRTYAFSSIERIRINGKTYKLTAN